MIEIFKKYSSFERVASRSEYWGVLLSLFGIAIGAILVASVLTVLFGGFGAFISMFALFAIAVGCFWITIATCVARCKDAGINPWFTLACFIPYIGTIVSVALGCINTKK